MPGHWYRIGYVITDTIHVIRRAVGWQCFCLLTLGFCGKVPHASGIVWGATPHSVPNQGSWSPLSARSEVLVPILQGRTPQETNPKGHWGPHYFLIKSLFLLPPCTQSWYTQSVIARPGALALGSMCSHKLGSSLELDRAAQLLKKQAISASTWGPLPTM